MGFPERGSLGTVERWRAMPFRDRRDAGARLGRALGHLRSERPVVLGLARGGVPVAAEVARALDASIDVLVARKLGMPDQPELGFGAIAEGNVIILNDALVERAGLSTEAIRAVARREFVELERRVDRYRGGKPPVPVHGRTVILIDDGIATGGTVRAAIESIRNRDPARLVLAAPIASPRTLAGLAALVDETVVLEQPDEFFAIGQFYDDFGPTGDDEVLACLPAGADPSIAIRLSDVTLPGDLVVPEQARGVVVFAHGSGSSRMSPRNRLVAGMLNRAGFATLLFDLLTPPEEADRANVFDIELLGARLVAATRWLEARDEVAQLPIGYFGASTGAAAALVAAATLGDEVSAVVSRGGRPDLAGAHLADVRAPTLFIVGGADEVVLDLNRQARAQLRCPSALEIVPGATHLFEEPGALERVADLARTWLEHQLRHHERAGRRVR